MTDPLHPFQSLVHVPVQCDRYCEFVAVLSLPLLSLALTASNVQVGLGGQPLFLQGKLPGDTPFRQEKPPFDWTDMYHIISHCGNSKPVFLQHDFFFLVDVAVARSVQLLLGITSQSPQLCSERGRISNSPNIKTATERACCKEPGHSNCKLQSCMGSVGCMASFEISNGKSGRPPARSPIVK